MRPTDSRSAPVSAPSLASLASPASSSSEAAVPIASSSLSWRCVCLLVLSWLAGVLLAVAAMGPALPEYDLAIENPPAGLTLELGPMSYLKLALSPREDTRILPKLCGFTWDGSSLRRWSVPYAQLHHGTLLIKGELRDLLPLAPSALGAIKELVFVVSSPLGLCQPAAVSGLQSLDALVEPWLGTALSSALGIRTLRLPVRLRAFGQ